MAPLSGEYHLPAPPRHSTPGTKTAKDKAGHLCLSVLCSAAFVVVFLLSNSQTIDRCFSLVLVPLGIGLLWGLIPVVQDWLITVNLARHSYTYHYIHQANAEELRTSNAEWSGKHNKVGVNRQEIDLVKRSKEERLEAENKRLLATIARLKGGVVDLDTEHLDDL